MQVTVYSNTSSVFMKYYAFYSHVYIYIYIYKKNSQSRHQIVNQMFKKTGK